MSAVDRSNGTNEEGPHQGAFLRSDLVDGNVQGPLDDGNDPGYIRPPTMGPYLTTFSIRDLEEFTGVKAHTIRIWEKRYGLLQPERSETNIRRYGLEELQKLMNVSFLNDRGFKISHLAEMTAVERAEKVRELGQQGAERRSVLNELEVAMLRFDEPAFSAAAGAFQAQHGFIALAEQVYLPLMEHVGLLWQTSSICPANEHFVSCLVRRHIEAETQALSAATRGHDRFVLFLPEHEIHELGLLYLNYLLRNANKRTIYLGQSVPMQDVGELMRVIGADVTLISILTTRVQSDGVEGFIRDLSSQVKDPSTRVWLTGPQVAGVFGQVHPSVNVRLFQSFTDLRPLLAQR